MTKLMVKENFVGQMEMSIKVFYNFYKYIIFNKYHLKLLNDKILYEIILYDVLL